MFIWFVFRDSAQNLWQSGLFTQSGSMKPAYLDFSTLAQTIAGETKTIAPGVAPTITLPVPQLAFATPAGSMIGVTYRVYLGNAPRRSRTARGSAPVSQPVDRLRGRLHARRREDEASIVIEAGDVNGNKQTTTYSLVTGKPT